MALQSHQSDPGILSKRTLKTHNPRLKTFLAPGMSVLDVGCGTGYITVGIAKYVGANGKVVGIDRDNDLLAIARADHFHAQNVSFENQDVLTLAAHHAFDLATAARTLQWIGDLPEAVTRLAKAVRPGGRIVIFDYDHTGASWTPTPPQAFRTFYDAFLNWRSANNWDNNVTATLQPIFESIGLNNIEIFHDDEAVSPGDARFDDETAIWTHVMESLGPRLIAASELEEARTAWDNFLSTSALKQQILRMRTLTAIVL